MRLSEDCGGGDLSFSTEAQLPSYSFMQSSSMIAPEKTQDTKKIAHCRNELNGRTVSVEVQDPEIVKTGLFKSTDVLFSIVTTVGGSELQKRV